MATILALYGIIAAFVVIMAAIPNEGLSPVFLLSAMAIACGGQVALDIMLHPHHRVVIQTPTAFLKCSIVYPNCIVILDSRLFEDNSSTI